jgi:hypothetical protein
LAESNGSESITKASLAGGGLGTVLVAIAAQLAPHNATLASFLTYAAPAISVSATASWVFAAAIVTRWRHRKICDQALARAREARDRICADPAASDTHKAEVRLAVEHFERLGIALIRNEFSLIDAKLEPKMGRRAGDKLQ